MSKKVFRRWWNFYKTPAGTSPVKKFLEDLSDEDAASVAAAMKEVRKEGRAAARHLRGDIYEVRAEGMDVIYRILFSAEGRYDQVLLALSSFVKKTQRTPPSEIRLAQKRLTEWRQRKAK